MIVPYFRKIKNLAGNFLFRSNSDSIIQIPHYGGKLLTFENQRLGKKLQYKLYERSELDFFSKVIKSDDICLDIGANVGAFTLLFSSIAKKVIAIEPLEINCKLIELSHIISNFKNLSVKQCVASDSNGSCKFVFTKETALSGILSTRKENHIEYIKNEYRENEYKLIDSKKITIDSLEIKKLDIIKIDVEGAEFSVIKGSLKTIHRCKPRIIMVEIVDQALRLYGQNISEFFKLMQENHYEPYVLEKSKLIPFKIGMYIPNDNIFFKTKIPK